MASSQADSTATAAAPAKAKPVKLSYKLQRELDGLPAEIERLESEVAELEAEAGRPDFYQQPSGVVTERLALLQDTQERLDAVMERWMELEAMAAGE